MHIAAHVAAATGFNMIKFYVRNSNWCQTPTPSSAFGQFVEATATKPFRFPGGEMHVESMWPNEVAVLFGHDPHDLITLRLWADSRRRKQWNSGTALIPYLPGARQDRGIPLSAAVYADIINGANLDKVICLDPHSDVMPALLKNCVIVPQQDIEIPNLSQFSCIIAPDSGASKKAFAIAQKARLPLIQAHKHRDVATGKLSGFYCPPLIPDKDGLVRALVADDICDGGGTFIGLAEAVRQNNIGIPLVLTLFVTHGIFSNDAMSRLTKAYRSVYTTNSFENVSTTDLTVVDAITTMFRYV
jgi:ribose-phosphate pyrophosphokinase